jgi:hypothetical protein
MTVYLLVPRGLRARRAIEKAVQMQEENNDKQ